jgi:hypothetical protein
MKLYFRALVKKRVQDVMDAVVGFLKIPGV